MRVEKKASYNNFRTEDGLSCMISLIERRDSNYN